MKFVCREIRNYLIKRRLIEENGSSVNRLKLFFRNKSLQIRERLTCLNGINVALGNNVSNFQSSHDNDNTPFPFYRYTAGIHSLKNYDDNNEYLCTSHEVPELKCYLSSGNWNSGKRNLFHSLLVSLYNFHYFVNCSNFSRFLVNLVLGLSLFVESDRWSFRFEIFEDQ